MGPSSVLMAPGSATGLPDRLRILLVAPPVIPVPPPEYAGTERVIAAIGDEHLNRALDFQRANVVIQRLVELEGELAKASAVGLSVKR